MQLETIAKQQLQVPFQVLTPPFFSPSASLSFPPPPPFGAAHPPMQHTLHYLHSSGFLLVSSRMRRSDQADLLLQVREYLEKHYEEKSSMEAVKLAIKALTETVEAGSKNIEVTFPTHHYIWDSHTSLHWLIEKLSSACCVLHQRQQPGLCWNILTGCAMCHQQGKKQSLTGNSSL